MLTMMLLIETSKCSSLRIVNTPDERVVVAVAAFVCCWLIVDCYNCFRAFDVSFLSSLFPLSEDPQRPLFPGFKLFRQK